MAATRGAVALAKTLSLPAGHASASRPTRSPDPLGPKSLGTLILHTNRAAAFYFTALLCAIPLSRLRGWPCWSSLLPYSHDSGVGKDTGGSHGTFSRIVGIGEFKGLLVLQRNRKSCGRIANALGKEALEAMIARWRHKEESPYSDLGLDPEFGAVEDLSKVQIADLQLQIDNL